MVNEKANINVTLNTQEAQHQLEELQKDMKRLIALKKKAGEKGDVEGYKQIDKELKKVNRQAGNLVREHKSLERTLKNINGASIKELKDAQRSLTMQTDKLNRETDEYTNKRAQLKLVKNEIAKINNEHRQTKSLMSRASDGFNKYFSIITAGAATFAGVFLGMRKAINTFNDFEERVSNLSSLTGLVGDNLNWLSQQAKDLSNSTLEGGIRITKGAQDIVDAFTKMGSARPELLANKEALVEVTKKALILAEASKMEMQPAIDAVAASMNQFNLGASESTRIINGLAAGSLAGSAEVDDITESLQNVGTVAADSNLTLENTVAVLETLAERQLKGSDAGTQLRSSLISMKAAGMGYTSGVFSMRDAIVELKAKIDSKSTALEKDNVLIEIFGKRNITVGTILANNIERYDEYNKAVTGTNTATEQAIVNTDNNNAKLAQARNRINIVSMELGNKLAPAYASVISKSSLMLKGLVAVVDIFAKYGRLIVASTVAITAYTLAIKYANRQTALQIATSKVGLAIEKAYVVIKGILTGKIKLATITQKAWNLALNANPIGLAIMAITALVVAIKSYDKYSKQAVEREKEKKAAIEQLTKANQIFSEQQTKFAEQVTDLNKLSVARKKELKDEIDFTLNTAKASLILQQTRQKEIQQQNTEATLWQKAWAVGRYGAGQWGKIKKQLSEDAKNNGLSAANELEDGINNLLTQIDNLKSQENNLNNILNAEKIGDSLGNETITQLEEKLSNYNIALKNAVIGGEDYLRIQQKINAVEEQLNKTKAKAAEEAQKVRDEAFKKAREAFDKAAVEEQNKLKLLLLTKALTEDEYRREQMQLELAHLIAIKALHEKFGQETATIDSKILDKKLEWQKQMNDTLSLFVAAKKSNDEKLKKEEDAFLAKADKAAEEEQKKREEADEKTIQSNIEKQLAAEALRDTQIETAIRSGMAAVENAKTLQEAGKAVINSIRDQIKAYMAEYIVTTLLSTMKNAKVGFPFNIILGTLAGGAATLLFNKIVPEFATGKYPGMEYTGQPQTGTYGSKPQLGIFNEVPGQPETVIDGITSRTINVNYPEIMRAVYDVRDGKIPQFAAGNYPTNQPITPSAPQSFSPGIDTETAQQLIKAINGFTKKKLTVYSEMIKKDIDELEEIKQTSGL